MNITKKNKGKSASLSRRDFAQRLAQLLAYGGLAHFSLSGNVLAGNPRIACSNGEDTCRSFSHDHCWKPGADDSCAIRSSPDLCVFARGQGDDVCDSKEADDCRGGVGDVCQPSVGNPDNCPGGGPGIDECNSDIKGDKDECPGEMMPKDECPPSGDRKEDLCDTGYKGSDICEPGALHGETSPDQCPGMGYAPDDNCSESEGFKLDKCPGGGKPQDEGAPDGGKETDECPGGGPSVDTCSEGSTPSGDECSDEGDHNENPDACKPTLPDECFFSADVCLTGINTPLGAGEDDACQSVLGVNAGSDQCNDGSPEQDFCAPEYGLAEDDICVPHFAGENGDECIPPTSPDVCYAGLTSSDECGNNPADKDECPGGKNDADECSTGMPSEDECPGGVEMCDECNPEQLGSDECTASDSRAGKDIPPPDCTSWNQDVPE